MRAQIFVHALRKVDMRAMIGQTSQASVVVRGASTSRRVHCYMSHPDELQVSRCVSERLSVFVSECVCGLPVGLMRQADSYYLSVC